MKISHKKKLNKYCYYFNLIELVRQKIDYAGSWIDLNNKKNPIWFD